MADTSIHWKIGGEAGYGIASAGAMFSRAMLRFGKYVFDYSEYPSLIRGGHNTFEASISDKPLNAQRRPVNILVALDQPTVDKHVAELAEDAAVIYNTDNTDINQATFPEKAALIGMSLETMAEKAGAPRVARNAVALGASFALVDMPFESLQQVIELNFELKHKEDTVIQVNVAAARAGYDYIRGQYSDVFQYSIQAGNQEDRIVLTGNDALSWGAIQAGCTFLSAYPMTPASSILHTLAKQAPTYNLVVKHVEDEISAINTAIGAGFAGVRAMTCTSGGGFCLMTEAWGMAGMMEVPIVAVEAMRTGPSSGMPTWGGQEDLKFVLNASHGELPRVVLAPGDIEECFIMMQQAFNIAEKYQTPVMVLTDKYLAASRQSVSVKKLVPIAKDRGQVLTEKDIASLDEYKRYALTDSGVSPRVYPGTPGGEHVENSDEHNEIGFSEESAAMRTRMVDKRFRKEALIIQDMPVPELAGDKRADLTLISWGSTKGVIREAMTVLAGQGKKVNHLHIASISPFPVKQVKDAFKKAKKVAVVEGNKTAQFAGWMREQTGLNPDYKILKYDGRPFFCEELVETIKNLK